MVAYAHKHGKARKRWDPRPNELLTATVNRNRPEGAPEVEGVPTWDDESLDVLRWEAEGWTVLLAHSRANGQAVVDYVPPEGGGWWQLNHIAMRWIARGEEA